jgi:Domain of unknown function (DUF1707)/Cell wall-active antibiotics response 4TMS YvqF
MSLSDHNMRAADKATTDNAVLAGARERVIALLTDRYAADSITQSEFEARLDQLHAARSASELNSLMRDLEVRWPGPAVGAAARDATRVDAQYDAALRLGEPPPEGRLLAALGETKRTGRWLVPRRLEMRVMLGEVLIDMRDAVLPTGESELAMVGVLGRIRVLVPPGVVVDTDMDAILSTVRNDAERDDAYPFASTVIRLTGSAVMTEVLVRVGPAGETSERAWKQAKQKRRR